MVFPTNVMGSKSGPIARENIHRAYADLSSYAINMLFRPTKVILQVLNKHDKIKVTFWIGIDLSTFMSKLLKKPLAVNPLM